MTRSFCTRTPLIVAALSLAALLTQHSEARGAQLVGIEPFAVVHDESVKMADLFPGRAPESLRRAAQEITLGAAPLPGSHRVFPRAQIEAAAKSNSNLAHAVAIPPFVDVTRWSRRLTAEEVLAVITRSLDENHLFLSQNIKPENLSWATVIVTEKEPKVEVTRIEEIPEKSATRFRLWSPSEPRLAPFWVTVNRRFDSVPFPAREPNALTQQGRTVSHPLAPEVSLQAGSESHGWAQAHDFTFVRSRIEQVSKGPVVVRAGQPVKAMLQAGGVILTSPAVSLGPGSCGAKIRVQTLLNSKTLLATVIDSETVRINH